MLNKLHLDDTENMIKHTLNKISKTNDRTISFTVKQKGPFVVMHYKINHHDSEILDFPVTSNPS